MTERTHTIILWSPSQKDHLLAVVQSLPTDGEKPFVVRISQKLPEKTEEQRGYFFSTVLPLFAAAVGEDEDNFYEEILKLWAPRAHYTYKGEEKVRIIRVSEMSAAQMSAFIDRCIREAAGIGCVIPPANKFWREERRKRA